MHYQRCLGELVHLLDSQTVILLAENENELFRLDETETVDGFSAVSDLDVLALIGDEIILSLPISPRHREGGCSTQEPINSNLIEKTCFCHARKIKNTH